MVDTVMVMKFLNISSEKVVTLFWCVSFDFIILAFNILGRTRASIMYLKVKSVNKTQFTYKTPLPEKVNSGLFSFRNN